MNAPACVNDMTLSAGNKFRSCQHLNDRASRFCNPIGESLRSEGSPRNPSRGSSKGSYQRPRP